MREKYVDERFPPWFTFGHKAGDPSTPNLVINFQGCEGMPERDILGSAEDIDALEKSYNTLQREFKALALAFSAVNNEAFLNFWYREKNHAND